MKNLFTLFIMATLLSTPACTDNNNDTTQEYTSFIITMDYSKGGFDDLGIKNSISGYFDTLGYCKKIAEHGDIVSNGGQIFTSPETKLPNGFFVDTIYLWGRSLRDNEAGWLLNPIILQKNKRNVINIMDLSKPTNRYDFLIVDTFNTKKYPH